jgi:hypothetical protein
MRARRCGQVRWRRASCIGAAVMAAAFLLRAPLVAQEVASQVDRQVAGIHLSVGGVNRSVNRGVGADSGASGGTRGTGGEGGLGSLPRMGTSRSWAVSSRRAMGASAMRKTSGGASWWPRMSSAPMSQVSVQEGNSALERKQNRKAGVNATKKFAKRTVAPAGEAPKKLGAVGGFSPHVGLGGGFGSRLQISGSRHGSTDPKPKGNATRRNPSEFGALPAPNSPAVDRSHL